VVVFRYRHRFRSHLIHLALVLFLAFLPVQSSMRLQSE
jgi:hypothetical protein